MEWRDRFIRNVLRIASVLGIVLIAAAFPTATAFDRMLFITMYIVLLAITLLPAPYILRVYLLLAMTTIVGINAILAWGPWADGSVFLLTTVILASLLLDDRMDVAFLTGSILFTLLIAYFTLQGGFKLIAAGVPETTINSWAVYIADFSIVGVIITLAANMLKGAFFRVVEQMQIAYQSLAQERKTLEEKVHDRTVELETRMAQLHASTTTARAIAELQEFSELLKKTADLIAERFEYYHVGVYILDEQQGVAHLQAASSETGKSLLGQGFLIEPDRKNLFFQVVENKKTVITSDLDRSNFIRDTNFPLTRSRMVMPLAVRGNLIGIIDFHSDQPRTFTPQDAEILQTLADLTAISFDNARLINETKSLLAQVEANTSLQTRGTWAKFTSRRKTAYIYTPDGVRPVFSSGRLNPGNEEGLDEGLFVPVVLHGQPIGRIKLKKRKGISNEWAEHERDLVEKISSQVALALENSRLVDEAQKNALRNQMIANFSAYVRETLDVESVIRSAATELRRVFDLKEAEILIGPAHIPDHLSNLDQ